jgi:hypothetical protein
MYSQYGEDEIVAEYFKSEGAPRRLLEIGAWDPIKFSNSRMFIERGWEALLCEFSPCPLRNLAVAYASNPRVKVIQGAITVRKSCYCREYELSDDGLSSMKPDEAWRETGGFYGKVWVPSIPLETLLLQFGGGHDFVSIDTEGTSVDLAIALLTAHQQTPHVVCVEHDGRVVELMQVVQGRGYKNVWANGTNVILVR